MNKAVLFFTAALTACSLGAKDIDVEAHVRKYWTIYQNKIIKVGNGDKRWPLTPALKAERQRHFNAVMQQFAPHHVEEAYLIDRIFGWEKGTYLGILRFRMEEVKKVPDGVNASHECTSWVIMDDLTGGKSIIMHKNRDSRKQPLSLLRRAMPGKHAWIGNGSTYSFYPSQGINDRGVVVMMNSGDPHPEAENSQYGLDTMMICRILLEECGTAEEAAALLKKIVYANAYTHVECGSIWFIGDAENVYIVEHNARKLTVRKVNSGFAIRANAFHYPEMQIYSLRSFDSLTAHAKREFAVKDHLINQVWRSCGIITALDCAAASRINTIKNDIKCYPPCGKNTISATTFIIDKEYPEYLSSACMVFASPGSSCYLPVPLTVREIPEAILNGSYSMHSFELADKKLPLLPEKELAELEKRLYARHYAAVEKARIVLRTKSGHTVQQEVARILNTAFAENFRDIQETVKKYEQQPQKK